MKVLTQEEIKNILEDAYDLGFSYCKTFSFEGESPDHEHKVADRERAVANILARIGEA